MRTTEGLFEWNATDISSLTGFLLSDQSGPSNHLNDSYSSATNSTVIDTTTPLEHDSIREEDDDDDDDDYYDDVTKTDRKGYIDDAPNQSAEDFWVYEETNKSVVDGISSRRERLRLGNFTLEAGLNETWDVNDTTAQVVGPEGREILYETYDYNSDASIPLYDIDADDVGIETVREIRFEKSRKKTQKKTKKKKKKRPQRGRKRKLPPREPLPTAGQTPSNSRTGRKHAARKQPLRATRVQNRPGRNRPGQILPSSNPYSTSDRKPRRFRSQDRGSSDSLSPAQRHNAPAPSSEYLSYESPAIPNYGDRPFLPVYPPASRDSGIRSYNPDQVERSQRPLYTYGTIISSTLKQDHNRVGEFVNPHFAKQQNQQSYHEKDWLGSVPTEPDPNRRSNGATSFDSFKGSGVVYLNAAPTPEQRYIKRAVTQRGYQMEPEFNTDNNNNNNDYNNRHAFDWEETKEPSSPPASLRFWRPGELQIYADMHRSDGQKLTRMYTPKSADLSPTKEIEMNSATADGSFGGIYGEFLLNFVPGDTAGVEIDRRLLYGRHPYFKQSLETSAQYDGQIGHAQSQARPAFDDEVLSNLGESPTSEQDPDIQYQE